LLCQTLLLTLQLALQDFHAQRRISLFCLKLGAQVVLTSRSSVKLGSQLAFARRKKALPALARALLSRSRSAIVSLNRICSSTEVGNEAFGFCLCKSLAQSQNFGLLLLELVQKAFCAELNVRDKPNCASKRGLQWLQWLLVLLWWPQMQGPLGPRNLCWRQQRRITDQWSPPCPRRLVPFDRRRKRPITV
jgi:hypothetical protein